MASRPTERGAERRLPGPAEVTGVLLCGGASRRMGLDKARLELRGRALIEYPLAALAGVSGRVVLACGDRPRYQELGCELALDSLPDCGPLAGLLAGLEAARTEWVAVLACDMPRARAGVLRKLLEAAVGADADACLLALERGTQPLLAVYRRRCAGAVRAALERGERRMVAFHGELVDGAGLRVIALDARRIDGEDCALNLNTPEDLDGERARDRARERGH